MKRGDFYEDDEPLADLLDAFEAGEPATVGGAVLGWTWWLDSSCRLRALSTVGAPVEVT